MGKKTAAPSLAEETSRTAGFAVRLSGNGTKTTGVNG